MTYHYPIHPRDYDYEIITTRSHAYNELRAARASAFSFEFPSGCRELTGNAKS